MGLVADPFTRDVPGFTGKLGLLPHEIAGFNLLTYLNYPQITRESYEGMPPNKHTKLIYSKTKPP